MTRLDQSKNNGKILVRILPGVLGFQTYRRFLPIRHNCVETVSKYLLDGQSDTDFVTDQEASCLFEKMPGGKVSTNQVHEV